MTVRFFKNFTFAGRNYFVKVLVRGFENTCLFAAERCLNAACVAFDNHLILLWIEGRGLLLQILVSHHC
jgi:hypothetical protein